MTIRYATVIEGGINYKVKFFGEDTISDTTYTRLNSYVPSVGDIAVFIVDSKGKYLCVGSAAVA